ncbi:MAG: PIN domain-containing protein [Patescibacteria group bacterium]
MIFVDTNYFLRYLIDDNSQQHLKAIEFFEVNSKKKKLIATSVLVFFEIFWNLTSFYQKSDLAAIEIMKKLLNMAFIKFESKTILANALDRASKGVISFEDCFNLEWATAEGINDLASFDKKLIREWNQ